LDEYSRHSKDVNARFPRPYIGGVIFTQGCNFDCFYCHNRALLFPNAPLSNIDDIRSFLERRRGLLDGIVLSGGEPTLQEDLAKFLESVKSLGYKTKLDTNGSHPEVVRALLDDALVDYVAMDYKALWRDYPKFFEVDASAVQKTLDLLVGSDIEWELRTTVFPQLHIGELLEMASCVPRLPRYALQLYRPPELYRDDVRFMIEARAYTPKELESMVHRIKEIQPNTILRA